MYDKNNLENFSARLRQCLKEKNLTQVELAKRAKMSKHSITKYLKKEREPRAKSASNLANALGVDAAWLLYGHRKTVAEENLNCLKGIPDDVSFERMHDILEEFAASNPYVQQNAAKIFKQAFEELYAKMTEKE